MIATRRKQSDEKAIAAAAGVTVRTLYDDRQKGFNGSTGDEYLAWRMDNVAPRKGGRASIGERGREIAASDLDEAEQRAKIAKLEEEARAKQLANDEREGRLLERDDVVLQVAEIAAMVRSTLEKMPRELESEIPVAFRAQMLERLEDYVRLMLTRMSQHQYDWEKPTQ